MNSSNSIERVLVSQHLPKSRWSASQHYRTRSNDGRSPSATTTYSNVDVRPTSATTKGWKVTACDFDPLQLLPQLHIRSFDWPACIWKIQTLQLSKLVPKITHSSVVLRMGTCRNPKTLCWSEGCLARHVARNVSLPSHFILSPDLDCNLSRLPPRVDTTFWFRAGNNDDRSHNGGNSADMEDSAFVDHTTI